MMNIASMFLGQFLFKGYVSGGCVLSLMFNCAQRLVDERNAEAFYLMGYKKFQAYTNPAQ